MASLGFIGLGISSVSGRCISKSSSGTLADKRAKVSSGVKLNKKAKVPFEVIIQLRKLKEEGQTPLEIFNNLGSKHMTFEYMTRVLVGDARVWS
jgi:hypothetical protein